MSEEYPQLHDLARQFRGLKPPRFTSAFESLVNAIACQQLTLTVGIRLLNRLAATYGTAIQIDEKVIRGFPQPGDLALASPVKLRELGFSAHKSRAIIELAQKVADGQLNLDCLAELPDSMARLRLDEIRGIGRWTAEYALLRGFGRVHIFPGDDVGARNNLQRWLNIPKPLDYQSVRALLGEWHRFGGLIYFHLLLRSLVEAGHLAA
jgi:DNA-3-methyladenine glycosylase II